MQALGRWRGPRAVLPAAGALLGGLLLAGCGPGLVARAPSVEPARAAQDVSGPLLPGRSGALDAAPQGWWPVATTSPLVPTGIEVVVRAGVDGIAIDGAGVADRDTDPGAMVWIDGPAYVARVDLTTGAARVWDVSADAAFGTVDLIRPSVRSGVWLVSRDRVRLFDAERFVRDIPVPPEVRGGPDGAVRDLVEVGSEVWLATSGGVARCTGAGWSMVRADQIAGAVAVDVDAAGSVWAAGRLRSGTGGSTVLRFSSAGWEPAGGQSAPRGIADIVATAEGAATVGGGAIQRFDGRRWHQPPRRVGQGAAPPVAVAVDSDSGTWVLGEHWVSRPWTAEGWAEVLEVEEPSLVDLGLAGPWAVVADERGLLRLPRSGSGEAVRLWDVASDQDASVDTLVDALVRARGRPGGVQVVAASTGEVWATVEGHPAPFHLQDGRWQEVAVPSPLDWGTAPVLTSDGAAVFNATSGLVRIDEDGAVLLAGMPVAGKLAAGWEGSVWLAPSRWSGQWPPPECREDFATRRELGGWEVTEVRPDGTRTTLVLPQRAWAPSSILAGPDDVLWVTLCDAGDTCDCPMAPALLRWDGQWSTVAYPGSGIRGVGVAPDGRYWAVLLPGEGSDGSPVLASYREGRWEPVADAGDWSAVDLVPDGSVCALRQAGAEVVCVERGGGIPYVAPAVDGALSVAPDGAMWVAGSGVVARLPRAASG